MMSSHVARKVLVIGASGAFGKQVLDVIKENPTRLQLSGLINSRTLMHDAECHLTSMPDEKTISMIKQSDYVVVAVPGLDGLAFILSALDHKKRVLSPSKESIILGWHLIKEKSGYNKNFIPLDSEIYALKNLTDRCYFAKEDIKYFVLGCTGGPFLNKKNLGDVTPKQALWHPVYEMGAQISVNSAILLNKAQEIIEASLYFDIPSEKIKILLCPTGLIHAGIVLKNGSFIPVINNPSLYWVIESSLLGERISDQKTNEIFITQRLDFREATAEEFPALELGWIGASINSFLWNIVFLAANERYVTDFLSGDMKFSQIIQKIKNKLKKYESYKATKSLKLHEIITFYKEVFSSE